jgi:hypothetical protein
VYADRFELLYRREASRPNQMWQADHTPLDIWILDERGRPVRPWLSVILDDYSRAVAGYALSLHPPSSIQTCRAINPELAGETVALKDIIRARNQRRRELRATLTERQAIVEALLGLRRGPEPELPLAEPEPANAASPPARPRLKRYFNE